MLRIGVIGYGYWGPNILRNFSALDDSRVVRLCDRDDTALAKARATFPGLETCKDHREITEAADIDAVAVVTPVSTHHALGKSALENGKHLFMEKPFTSTSAQAVELVELADRKNLVVMVDHTFLFTGVVRKVKEIYDNGEMGDLLYYDSTRVNLGLFQHDVNVIWDLAPHDFSVIDHLAGLKPLAIAASGYDHYKRNLVNIAHVTIYFEQDVIAYFNLNWLSPVKIRQTLIAGSKKMLVWDDVQPDEKLKVYDKGVEIQDPENVHQLLISYRTGDMHSPKLEPVEALRLEARYFVDCVAKGETPFNDGQAGLRIVRWLEASEESLKNGSRQIEL